MSQTNTARGGEFATARRGVSSDTIGFINAKAKAGVPLSAIAKMVGLSVLDVAAANAIVVPRHAYGQPTVLVVKRAQKPTETPAPVAARGLPPTAQRIIASVADKHGLTVADLRGRSQRYRIAHARQEAFFELMRHGYSSPLIGSWFGRDHTTVLHGVCAHRNRIG